MRNKNWDKEELNKLYNREGKTLQEIGDMRGVSRERVRQVMEELGLARGFNRSRGIAMGVAPYTLEGYLGAARKNPDIVGDTLRRLLGEFHCSECGKAKHLHIHHIVYPATSLRDIQVLCASCHYAKHRKGITYLKQIDIYNQYMGGITTIALAEKYKVTRILIYKILQKIRNGNTSIRGKNRFGKMSRKPTGVSR